ncbi:MAG TPA: hypothetical protein PLF84_14635 [Bryobacteraceae bacterium]|nr:hypothetical protein [Bryobacterales bacterium]HRJ20282.1 hypothetical protein [Bryobacteraceae bacterium]
MSTIDPAPENTPKKAARRHRRTKPLKRQLRVVFDSNVLYTGSASDLVQKEVVAIVEQSKYPDLEVVWYLPEIVRHERHYQMRKKALDLQPGLAKIEKLLGHNLGITEEILLKRVEDTVAQRQSDLGLVLLKLNYEEVDWERMARDSAYRRAPFQVGDTEKGFRDALLAESFLQLVGDSPKASQACRIVLVTGDKLLTEAVESRLNSAGNVRVIASVEELRGFINTLVSEVDETFVALWKDRAAKKFFIQKDESTLYYAEHIRDLIAKKFEKELAVVPAGAQLRKNGIWRISSPNFSKKSGQRVHWVSRIEVEAEATRAMAGGREIVLDRPLMLNQALSSIGAHSGPYGSLPVLDAFGLPLGRNTASSSALPLQAPLSLSVVPNVETAAPSLPSFATLLSGLAAASNSTVVTHRGKDIFEVLWSVDVTIKDEIRRHTIDDCVHVDTIWEAVT